MIDQICQGIDNGTYAPGVITITDQGESPVGHLHLHATGPLHGGGTIQLRQNGSNVVTGGLTLAQMTAFDDFLLNSAQSPTTYRNIKKNLDWQGLYGYATRTIPYADKGGNVYYKNKMTVACRECGILLHEKLVTIDHYHAKKGDPLDPVFKIFRSVGYTNQLPAGVKGQTVHTHIHALVGGLNGGNNTYSLNAPGIIVYSLFRSSGYYQNLVNLAMHHYINLRPVCSHCNPSLGVH